MVRGGVESTEKAAEPAVSDESSGMCSSEAQGDGSNVTVACRELTKSYATHKSLISTPTSACLMSEIEMRPIIAVLALPGLPRCDVSRRHPTGKARRQER